MTLWREEMSWMRLSKLSCKIWGQETLWTTSLMLSNLLRTYKRLKCLCQTNLNQTMNTLASITLKEHMKIWFNYTILLWDVSKYKAILNPSKNLKQMLNTSRSWLPESETPWPKRACRGSMLIFSTKLRESQWPKPNLMISLEQWSSTSVRMSLKLMKEQEKSLESLKIWDFRLSLKNKLRRRLLLSLKSSRTESLRRPKETSRKWRQTKKKLQTKRLWSTKSQLILDRLFLYKRTKYQQLKKKLSSSRPDGWCKITKEWMQINIMLSIANCLFMISNLELLTLCSDLILISPYQSLYHHLKSKRLQVLARVLRAQQEQVLARTQN